MSARCAIFFAPPAGSALEAFGRSWLGRDHITGEPVAQPALDEITADDLKRITKATRHYGFHATLKAPFMLKEGVTAADLRDAAERFAAERLAFDSPPLKISSLPHWVAFTLSAPCPAMDRLAADCVRAFEPFRAPLTAEDIERRRKGRLTARQDEQLLAYGYPYIFEDFQFHMTLAGPLDPEGTESVRDIVERLTSDIEPAPLTVDTIAIYEQPDRDQPFRQTARFPFRGV